MSEKFQAKYFDCNFIHYNINTQFRYCKNRNYDCKCYLCCSLADAGFGHDVFKLSRYQAKQVGFVKSAGIVYI